MTNEAFHSGNGRPFAAIGSLAQTLRRAFTSKRENVMRSAHFALTLVIWASCSTAYGQGQVLNRTLQHDGLARSYTLYIPPSYTGSEAWPLVFDLHGAGGDASWQMSNAGMNAVANTGNFLVAYPNATVAPGYGKTLWNDGSLFPNGPDDVDFISTMIDELATSYHIDSSRVYATGLSNGGAMSYYLASQLPNRLAAIAAVGAPRPANPTAPRPLPMLHVHGTADSFVPIAGGFLNIPLPGGEYFSTFRALAIDDVIDDWRESNGCVGEPVITQLPDFNTRDSSTVTLIHYEDCERYLTAAGDEHSAEVLYYMIEGGGHTWPGGGMAALFGPTNRDINASEIWNFFSRHELPVVPVPGDFNRDGTLDVADIDDLTIQTASGTHPASYDLNADALVNDGDIKVWVGDLFHSWIGDANLDVQFNSSDLVAVLAAGTYEVDVDSVWSRGDFNGDGRTNSGDLVAALADGGYEMGALPAMASVPEPATLTLLVMAAVTLIARRRSSVS
jgi:polyhydroxybutyrate depolymerase